MNKLNVIMVGIGHSHAQGVMYEFLAQRNTFEVLGDVEHNPWILHQK